LGRPHQEIRSGVHPACVQPKGLYPTNDNYWTRKSTLRGSLLQAILHLDHSGARAKRIWYEVEVEHSVLDSGRPVEDARPMKS